MERTNAMLFERYYAKCNCIYINITVRNEKTKY